MKVLVACECSGVVRDAFRAVGHNAYSCDLKPTETTDKQFHIQSDVKSQIYKDWDIVIAHPPCTYLAVSGARWLKDSRYPNRQLNQEEAKAFFMCFIGIPAKHVCIENPIGVMSSFFRKPDQIIQPYQFGHAETKATCLWLKNLPKLEIEEIVKLSEDVKVTHRIHWLSGKNRSTERSRTYSLIGRAMAVQWGVIAKL